MEEGDDDGEEDGGGGVSGDRPPAPNKTAPKKAAASSSSASSTQQPQQWEWESVRNKLRDALTEMSVLSDVITVATKVDKTLQLVVMDLVMLTFGILQHCFRLQL